MWIKLSDRKPDEGEDIIAARFVANTIDWAIGGFYDSGEFSCYPDYTSPPSDPTHWMEMPVL